MRRTNFIGKTKQVAPDDTRIYFILIRVKQDKMAKWPKKKKKGKGNAQSVRAPAVLIL